MNEEKIIKLTKEQALECMVIKDNQVHNFIQAGFGLVGADYPIKKVKEMLDEADRIEIGGQGCKAQTHYNDTLIHLVVADELDIYNVHCLIFNFATRGMNAQVYHRDTIEQKVFEVYICLYDKYGFSKIKNIKPDTDEYKDNFSSNHGYLI